MGNHKRCFVCLVILPISNIRKCKPIFKSGFKKETERCSSNTNATIKMIILRINLLGITSTTTSLRNPVVYQPQPLDTAPLTYHSMPRIPPLYFLAYLHIFKSPNLPCRPPASLALRIRLHDLCALHDCLLPPIAQERLILCIHNVSCLRTAAAAAATRSACVSTTITIIPANRPFAQIRYRREARFAL